MQVITFDFHNTLAAWPTQFELEVRSLPAVVLGAIGVTDQALFDLVSIDYRHLREDVIATGVEVNAYDAIFQLLARHGHPKRRNTIVNLVDTAMAEAIEDFVPVLGAVETVLHLHACGVPLGIVSSTIHHRSIEWALSELNIDHCFQEIVTSASSGFYKSVPTIYEVAFAALGGDPRASLHVGDSLRWDVTGAARFGTNTVWLRTDRVDRFANGHGLAKPTFTLESMIGAGPVIFEHLATVGEAIRVK